MACEELSLLGRYESEKPMYQGPPSDKSCHLLLLSVCGTSASRHMSEGEFGNVVLADPTPTNPIVLLSGEN